MGTGGDLTKMLQVITKILDNLRIDICINTSLQRFVEQFLSKIVKK